MDKAVIVGYARSPFTLARKGQLAGTRPDEIATQLVRGLVSKLKLKVGDIEDLMMGCAFPEAEQGMNVARLVGLMAGLPLSAAGVTVNRFCGSSMQTAHMAAQAALLGNGDLFIAAGVESMTRVPMGGYNYLPHPKQAEEYPQAHISMGMTAENVAKKHNISRKEQEEFALASHQRAAAARKAGRLAKEIIPIAAAEGVVDQDGGIRDDATLQAMAGLEPVFLEKGSVTAATSSPLTDGASAVAICTASYAAQAGLKPLAIIRGMAVAGCAPEVMGLGPVPATAKALARAALKISDIDLIELNEAFAAQSLGVMREAGFAHDRTNLDGGAIALGHPLGASGARLLATLTRQLHDRDKQFGLATMCIGGGMGIATVLERAS